MPIYLLKASRSWGTSGWLWVCCLHPNPVQGEGLLDYKEFVGAELGREWILQDLQGS